MLTKTLLEAWYHKRHPWLTVALLPLALVFRLLSSLRRRYYHLRPPQPLPLPVIVVGNINLGGSGKSPLLIALVEAFRQHGYAPGVVSRGYGSRAPSYPFFVTAESNSRDAGDEPLMIARRIDCPLVVDADRYAAAQALVSQASCDVILSDDGLQHYALPRDLEIIVIDGRRLLGNERLLPAGPLRECSRRLQQADMVVINGSLSQKELDDLRERWQLERLFQMELRPTGWRRVLDGKRAGLGECPWGEQAEPVHAVAGIGNPERFFDSLRALGLTVIPHAFPDHHDFTENDLDFGDGRPVIMTEKDAVKCQQLLGSENQDRYWYLQVDAELEAGFYTSLLERVKKVAR